MRKISANPSHIQRRHMWVEGGFLMQAWLCLHLTHSPGNRSKPKSQLHTHTHKHIGRKSRCISVTAWIGGYCSDEWRSHLTQHHPIRLQRYMYGHKVYAYMHTQCLSLSQTITHKAMRKCTKPVQREGEWSICGVLFWLYKQALDSIFRTSCSLNSINLKN